MHRAGRLAQAGQASHALLFLLPSERQYVEVLELRSLRDVSPLSLSSMLSLVVALCRGLMQEGESTALMGSYNNAKGDDVNPDDGNGRLMERYANMQGTYFVKHLKGNSGD